eukprot:CAMPEP_0201281802 /NCGR_PEP_ID=MMETSP1317-20130820/4059_1 /ASSEMBLY_ACC=CAM_ASM_000770 /TAXON_ID=187299 /ORGANISM="Undescribed Undescribed, Strain Undescribed" /LENGTH=63 /DNA_ID=CAMNT_0047592689 /DNA_START=2881 /DNA_END=3072 /DNA_ORIENTATION=-
MIVDEYLLTKDTVEAIRCIKELDQPQFLHEVIKKGFEASAEVYQDSSMIVELIKELLVQDMLA